MTRKCSGTDDDAVELRCTIASITMQYHAGPVHPCRDQVSCIASALRLWPAASGSVAWHLQRACFAQAWQYCSVFLLWCAGMQQAWAARPHKAACSALERPTS